jgi:hypothetical protein
MKDLAMRFLADENVTGTVIQELRQRGHDVLSVKESMRSEQDEVMGERRDPGEHGRAGDQGVAQPAGDQSRYPDSVMPGWDRETGALGQGAALADFSIGFNQRDAVIARPRDLLRA